MEYVGISLAAALLLAGVGSAMHGPGRDLGVDVGDRIDRLIAREQPAPVTHHATSRAALVTSGSGQLLHQAASLLDGRTRTWRDRRRSGGQTPVHVPRDDLRLRPVVDPAAVWQRDWARDGSVAGFGTAADARACFLCGSLEWSHGLQPNAGRTRRGGDVGLEGSAEAETRLALASVEAGARVGRQLGPAALAAQGRVRGTVGLEGDAKATLRLGPGSQRIELRGGAMAGAAARAEGKVGVELLGVAITQSGRAEGWAGAGARGVADLRREGSTVEWNVGWGAALGLGGAAEWGGSVDVSEVPVRHRRLARDALLHAAAITPMGRLLFLR